MGQFFEELKHRNVMRVAIAYLAIAWLLIQIAETLFPIFGQSDTLIRLVAISLIIGFPLVLIFSWLYELTPEGLKLERDVDRARSIVQHTGKKLDRAIIIVLTLALGYFAFDKFMLDPARDAEREETVAKQARSEALVESYGDKSIAVLPFVDMSSSGDQEYFSDGLSEELSNVLAKIPDLRVISRSSSFTVKGKDIDVPTIAAKFNVSHVLEGSVRTDGNRVRITAQLIDARSDTHLWSETYDRNLIDIFAIHDEIAAHVVEALKLTLLRDAPKVWKTDPAAYTLYLQARYVGNLGASENLQTSIELYQQVLAIDPGYVPAWDGMAEGLLNQANVGLRPGEGYEPAREAAKKALALDPGFARSHGRLGWISLFQDGDLAAAARHYQRALALDSTDLISLGGAAILTGKLGRLDEAIAVHEYVVARDPIGPVGHSSLGIANLYAGHLDAAAANFRTTLTLSKDYLGAHCLLGMTMLLRGESEKALPVIEQESFEPFRLICLALVYHALGDASKSDTALHTLIGDHAEGWAYNIAYIFADRGDADAAFEWLEQAVENQDGGLADIAVQPFFAKLVGDPRWREFLDKVGKSEEQMAMIEFSVILPE